MRFIQPAVLFDVCPNFGVSISYFVLDKGYTLVCSKPILALWSPASCAVARPAPLLFRGPSAIISPWAAKPALFGLLLRLPGRVERPSCLVSLDIQGFPGSWAPDMPDPAAAAPGPVYSLSRLENTLFPAEMTGFLMPSRPFPVYPGFLKYVVPVQKYFMYFCVKSMIYGEKSPAVWACWQFSNEPQIFLHKNKKRC